MQAQYRRPGTMWYVSDGWIWDELPLRPRHARRALECASRLFIFNPQMRRAKVQARFYHADRAPTSVEVSVAAGRLEALSLETLAAVPHRQAFWIAVESDIPVLPQARHEDYTFWDLVPDAMTAVAPYPGPLRDETRWIFPDCYESEPDGPWYERETLTILNPNPRKVTVQVQYCFRYLKGGAEEEIEIPAERVAALNVWERRPRPIGRRGAPGVGVFGDYCVYVDASHPVIAQTTRRARWSGYPQIIGSRSTMGVPRGGASLWYYPGGEIMDHGVLPRAKATDHPLSQCDNTWNLLFVNNPNDTAATASVTFHAPDGRRQTAQPLPIAPRRSILESLHAAPWLGRYTHVGQPYALTVTADQPVVPDICGAEFELWSQVMPGAMTAVNMYPGPVRGERTWWLGIGQAGGDNDVNAEWRQSYHLFNPGRRMVRVTLSFLGLVSRRRPVTRTVEVAAGGVAVVRSEEVRDLPMHEPFAVKAEAEAPFCAQTFGRTFTRGLRHTRAMSSAMGVPMRLTEG